MPCGVLVLLSSMPRDRSFLGTLVAVESSVMPICFCLLRFLLHSSWQSCHKGRLQRTVRDDQFYTRIYFFLIFFLPKLVK